MAFNEDELRRRLQTAAAHAGAPGFSVEELIRRVRRRRAAAKGALSGTVLAMTAAAVAIPVIVTGPGQGAPSQPGSTGASARPSSSESSAAAPGTVRLTCSDADWTSQGAGWRAHGLWVGPLWLARTTSEQNPRIHAVAAEVAYGATVTVKPSPSVRSYFRFFDRVHIGGADPLPAGDTGFTFVSCPRIDGPGPNGLFTDFYVAFSLPAGRSAAVDIWTPAARRPTQVIFTCSRSNCHLTAH